MIRIITKTVDICPEGAVTATRYCTFDIDHPEIEALLRTGNVYSQTSVIGAETLPAVGEEV